ncbi:MAG: hypothetical protein FJ265_18475 [Planctomycetes bacterium]|nr:hypothetical protein [Planctomycetota bacterium]
MSAQRPSSVRSAANRLLLVANLVAGNAFAALAVIGFLRPSVLGGAAAPDGAAAAAAERVVVLPLSSGAAWGVFVAGIVLLLWNFAWLVRRPERRPPVHWVTSDTPSGPVRVAREALEVGLRAAGETLPEVTRLRVQVDTSVQKRILVTGLFQCAEGTSNLAASQRLRQTLLDRFGEMVRPIDGARVEVDLEFQGFQGKLGKKAGEVPPAEEPAPFTGPKYPIGDDPEVGGTS